MCIYAMSDIHGCLGDLERRLAHLRKLGFFDDARKDRLVLIGDFIDRGPDGLGVVRRVMALEDECPGRVTSLMGNHEAEMLEWVGTAPAEKSDAALEGDLPDDERALLGEVLAEGTDDEVLECPGRVRPLMGNHEAEMLEWVGEVLAEGTDDEALARLRMWQGADKGGLSMGSFAGAAALADIEAAVAAHDDALATAAFERACEKIRSGCAAELRWMSRLAPYLKTARHVFVHSGIDESQGAEWELATPLERMLAGRETTCGPFVLDVVCGHTPAEMVAEKVTGDGSVEGVWWDGASHFYVDGATAYTHRLPTLVCDEAEGRHLELDECGRPREIASAARR